MNFERRLFEENGFHIKRGLFSQQECEQFDRKIRATLPDVHDKSVPDAVNKMPWLVSVMADIRLKELAEVAGILEPKFLQVADIQLDHNRENWHRDSACRVFGTGDWNEATETYRVVKAIIYLDINKAGLAVVPGSHRIKTKLGKIEDKLENFDHIVAGQKVNNKLYDDSPKRPAFVEMSPGDVLLFDERLLHAGRRLNAAGTEMSNSFVAPKSTLAFVYGDESRHSWRFHSYFRFYRKELKYKQYSDTLVSEIGSENLLPSFYDKYIVDTYPEEQSNMIGK